MRPFEPHDDRSIKEILEARKEYTDTVKKLFGMPSNVCKIQDSENPYAMTWVLKAGISPERASDVYGMRWSEKMERVLIPIYNRDRRYTGLVGRSVSSGPKYVMLQGRPLAYFQPRTSDAVVVTEDILSAIVIQEAGTTAYAMLGTAVQNEFVEVLSEFRQVFGWADPDSAGRKAQAQLRKRLAMYDKRMTYMQSEVDPKYIPRDEIRRAIDERLLI